MPPGRKNSSGICFMLLAMVIWLGIGHVRPLYESAAFATEKKSVIFLSPSYDFDDPPDTNITLAPNLTFGAEVEIESEMILNPDLDRGTRDDRLVIQPQLDMAFSYDPTESFRVYLEMELTWELDRNQAGDSTEEISLEINQLYVTFRDFAPGATLQIGRQEFKDDREWLVDEDLDAVRIFHRVSRFGFELSASRENLFVKDLFRDEESRPINYYFFQSRYAITSDAEAALYGLLGDDRTQEKDSPLFLGFRSGGKLGRDLKYWVEMAHVRGKEKDRQIRGYGFDIGATRGFDLRLNPYLTLGYAFATGDDNPEDNIDRNFRQTGFQDNTARFGGVTKLKYYGEALDPELSNLSIFTFGMGIRPLKTFSIDLIHHYYRQHKSSDKIRDSQLERDPTGERKNIGQEIDLVMGWKADRPDIGIELGAGYFIPGDAFPPGSDSALGFRFELQYSF